MKKASRYGDASYVSQCRVPQGMQRRRREGKFLDATFVCDTLQWESLLSLQAPFLVVQSRPMWSFLNCSVQAKTGCFSKISLVAHALVGSKQKKKCICFCLMQPHLSKNRQKVFRKKNPNNIWDFKAVGKKFYFHHCVCKSLFHPHLVFKWKQKSFNSSLSFFLSSLFPVLITAKVLLRRRRAFLSHNLHRRLISQKKRFVQFGLDAAWVDWCTRPSGSQRCYKKSSELIHS